MSQEPSLLSFRIDRPYGVALRMVRNTLSRHGLRAPAELDIAAGIRQQTGAGVAPCAVLYVDDPVLLLEAVLFHRGAGLLIPQPLVVTGGPRSADVLLRGPDCAAGDVPDSVRDPLRTLQVRMARALEQIAEPTPDSLAACRHPAFR